MGQVRQSFVGSCACPVCLLDGARSGRPAVLRLPARIGAFGLLLTGQLLFLWGNRRDVSPYHQARQHFIAGEYRRAKAILEASSVPSRESVDALVLLGNCYRHLAQFDQCRAALERALAVNPRHHLAHFSLGKLCLILGEYSAAVTSIQLALEHGAPAIVHFELGQARFLSGDDAASRRAFNELPTDSGGDPGQALLLNYYLHCLGEAPHPTPELIGAGLDCCRSDAAKYAGTSYGDHMSLVVGQLERTLAPA